MIRFQHVTKTFSSDFSALENFSLEVHEGEILVLLGQSGSGKTTALRLINRLIEPTTGKIFFQGKDIQTLDPIQLRRQIGYAIQHIGLFPHMTVGENISIVPKLLGWSESKISTRIDELLSIMNLGPEYRNVMPAKLSGGQKQRIGVARALAADPPVILMDEPFGALDPLMREQLQNEFLDIQAKIQKTIVFVTHDLREAVKMGDQIAMLKNGKLLQISTPPSLIENPATEFIDQFLGKDRIQLLLQTKTLNSLIQALLQTPPNPTQKIPINSSYLETLTAFKIHQTEALAVFDKESYVGNLDKKSFLETLLKTI